MESERTYSASSGRVTKVTITEGRAGTADGTGGLFGNLLQPQEEESGETKEKDSAEDFLAKTMEEMSSKQSKRTISVRTPEMEETRKQLYSIRQQCLNFLMNLLFWRQRNVSNDTEAASWQDTSGESALYQAAQKQSDTAGSRWQTFSFSKQYYYEEAESTTFTTQGTVKCADGRELSFNLNLNMSRSFQEYYEETYQVLEASMTDPLVINLDGNIAQLSDQTFYFDIDGDGELDEINRLAEGSGYLALDKNGDGTINDGTELFGTASGNGFQDLAVYDTDGNGFIDEGDEIFQKLKIWTIDESGKEELVSLTDKGIGAICLQNAAGDFSLTDEENQTKGMIRSTGFFLYEDGGAGTVQQVDVARYDRAV
jgi:hypothetical protein